MDIFDRTGQAGDKDFAIRYLKPDKAISSKIRFRQLAVFALFNL